MMAYLLDVLWHIAYGASLLAVLIIAYNPSISTDPIKVLATAMLIFASIDTVLKFVKYIYDHY